jgi:alpha-L-rhamnosidase
MKTAFLRIFFYVLISALTTGCSTVRSPSLPIKLQCEYLSNALGIDARHPRLGWQLQDTRTSAEQTGYQLIVGTDSQEVSTGNGNYWQSGKIASAARQTTYQGQPLQPFTKYYFTVQVWDQDNKPSKLASVSSFETGMMNAANWQGAWISDSRDVNTKPAPYFRKMFSIDKKIRSARAYIAVAGLYELYINGNRIGDHRLDPVYTRFDRRTIYLTHDITAQLQNGKNAIGVLLGNGWYNHQSKTAGWFFHEAPWRNRPTFCMDLRITYEDGTVETITSEKDWKTSLSPVIFNSIYTGEHYDARQEQPGWNQADFDDSKWNAVIYRTAPSNNIVAQAMQPIRIVDTIPAKSMHAFNSTNYVFDLGRNIAGVTRISIKAPAGTVLRLKHGERLLEDGHVDISNIAVHYRPVGTDDPFGTDIYTCSGKEESFMPRFNYKGFQYVEVSSSAPVPLTKESLTGYFMHSDVAAVGTFTTSNNTINKIWQAANNSYLSNLYGYPTDCPQREKNGWTGDAHIASETGLYNFDGITIYEKWLADHQDEQQANGVLPAIIPTSGWGYDWANGPDWTSTIAIIPWNIYLFYGDTTLLARCYNNIQRYVDHIDRLYPTGLTTWGLGDWVPVKSQSSVELTSSIYYYVDAGILAKAAHILGRKADAEKYDALTVRIRDAINGKYLNAATGIYGNGVQTELSFPLYWGVVPDSLRSKVAANLAQRVQSDSNHIDVGLLGTKSILNALSENGYADLAYKVAAQETYPSWGWWIVNGATTLYENWKIDSKQDISFNHIMFGEIGAWFYKGLGGIKPDTNSPGFKNILLEPHFVTGLNQLQASHDSPYGRIVSSWMRTGNGIMYTVVVPANSSATLKLTIPNNLTLYKNGQSLSAKGDYTDQLKAGSYEFAIK